MPRRPPPNPVIVVPGITASTLRDEYELGAPSVWGMIRKSYERVAQHPDDLRYEELEPARVAPDEVFSIPYRELIEELRHDLSAKADRPTPVFPFAYDWRQHLPLVVEQLRAFVEEVVARTRLMRHYHPDYAEDPQVNLLGHSMGGLVIAGYLREYGRDSLVGRVATLGTPFQGSLEAVVKVATGLAVLGDVRPSSREREVARITPALYYLMPSYPGAAHPEGEPGVELSSSFFFEVGSWQPSILATLAEYIRLHGLPARGSRSDRARDLLAHLLGEAQAYRARIDALDLADAGLALDDWLCIVGVGSETRTRMPIGGREGARSFVVSSSDRQDGFFEEDPGARIETGDGTVPYLGARASFLPVDKVVCVSPKEFGFWEVADRVLAATAGFHGVLPKVNLVHRLIASHFRVRRGEVARAGRGTLGRAAPDLPGDSAWDPPLKGLERREP